MVGPLALTRQSHSLKLKLGKSGPWETQDMRRQTEIIPVKVKVKGSYNTPDTRKRRCVIPVVSYLALPYDYYIIYLYLSPIKPNRAKRPRSFRRANHAELKLPPLAKLLIRRPQRRVFRPEAGILVRCRSLGACINIEFYP
jgi:hypothetical protein